MISFAIAQGIYNPAKDNHSWVVIGEYDTRAEAYKALDQIVADDVELPRGERVLPAHRDSYDGAPLAVVRISTRVLTRVGVRP